MNEDQIWREQLQGLARGSDWFMAALRAARSLALPSWCIGAGAVRNLVWDALHGYARPSALADVDLAYFDAGDLSAARDAALQTRLSGLAPAIPWEVTNQAGVHLWFEACFGHPVEALGSLEEAIASWPEYATAVGIRLETDEALTVMAPLGLADLFEMRVRRNPRRVSVETYRQRVAQKNYAARWPQVSIVASD
jgi:hypothetical protein